MSTGDSPQPVAPEARWPHREPVAKPRIEDFNSISEDMNLITEPKSGGGYEYWSGLYDQRGRKQGLWRQWDIVETEEGNRFHLLKAVRLKSGRRVGNYFNWHPSGQPMLAGSLTDGRAREVYWYESGAVRADLMKTDFKLDGECAWYTKDGELDRLRSGIYKDDFRIGGVPD